MAIILQDNNLWNDIGRAVGQWGAGRLTQLDNINTAKQLSNVLYGQEPQAQVVQDDSSNMQLQVPRNFSQAVQFAQSEQNPIDLWKRTQGMQMTQPQAVQTPLINNPQKSFFDEAVPVKKENALPELPNKEAMRNETRKMLGKDFVDLVRSGMSLSEAKDIIDNKLEQESTQRYNENLRKYQDTVLEPMRQQIMNALVYTQDENGNTVVDGYNSSRVKGLVPAVERYNHLARQAGLNGLDMNNLNAVASLTKPNAKYETMPNGDFVSIDGNTGAVNKLGNYAKPQSARENYIPTNNGLFDVRTGKIVEGTQKPNVQGTSGYDAQIVRSLSQQHIAWMKANLGKNEWESPFYAQLQSALGTGSTQSGSRLDESARKIANRIDALRAEGWTPEQIKNGLKEEGLDEFESWVW